MSRFVLRSFAMTTLCMLFTGCGDSTGPSAASQTETPAPAETTTDAQPAGVDMTPVLPIPDDVPSDSEQPAEAQIKPIPDDQ